MSYVYTYVYVKTFCGFISGENRISTQEVQLHYIGDPDKDFLNQCLNGMDSINCEEFPFIDLATLNVATENFSNSNKLGQGGFGPVYKVKNTFLITNFNWPF